MPKRSEHPVRLGKREVDRIQPRPEGDFAVPDRDLPGFELRVWPSGRKVYSLRYRTPGGRQRRMAIGNHGEFTPEQARMEAENALMAARRGEDPARARDLAKDTATFAAFAERYMKEHANVHQKPSTVKTNRWYLDKCLIPVLGTHRMSEIMDRDLRKLLAKYNDRKTLANRLRSMLSSMFSMAAKWGDVPRDFNPVADLPKHKERARERFLNAEEIGRLFRAIADEEAIGGISSVSREGKSSGRGGKDLLEECSHGIYPHVASLYRLLTFTGACLGEIQNLTWDAVNWDQGALDLADSKTGKKRIWLSPPAIEELRKLQKIATPGCPWVIEGRELGTRLVNALKPWTRVRKRAGMEDLRLHDLRHAWASIAVAQGVGLPLIGKALGHRNVQTTQRYAHATDDPIRLLTALVGSRITEVVDGYAPVVELEGKTPESTESGTEDTAATSATS